MEVVEKTRRRRSCAGVLGEGTLERKRVRSIWPAPAAGLRWQVLLVLVLGESSRGRSGPVRCCGMRRTVTCTRFIIVTGVLV